MEVFIGVVLGGIISLVTTLAVDTIRGRRELQRRWDASSLEAIEHFIDVANLAIGAMFDEGRSRGRRDPEDPQDRIDDFDRQARAALDNVRVAHARTRLLLAPLELQLAAYRTTLDELKRLANRGFSEGDKQWKAVQTELGEQLDALLREATKLLLGIGAPHGDRSRGG